jgi:hypothetical protein
MIVVEYLQLHDGQYHMNPKQSNVTSNAEEL